MACRYSRLLNKVVTGRKTLVLAENERETTKSETKHALQMHYLVCPIENERVGEPRNARDERYTAAVEEQGLKRLCIEIKCLTKSFCFLDLDGPQPVASCLPTSNTTNPFSLHAPPTRLNHRRITDEKLNTKTIPTHGSLRAAERAGQHPTRARVDKTNLFIIQKKTRPDAVTSH